jgi:hypothetical protein
MSGVRVRDEIFSHRKLRIDVPDEERVYSSRIFPFLLLPIAAEKAVDILLEIRAVVLVPTTFCPPADIDEAEGVAEDSSEMSPLFLETDCFS